MNLQNNFTKQKDSIQAVFKNWDNKILSHLPSNLDEMAKCAGILQRKRGIRCANGPAKDALSLRQFKRFFPYPGRCRLHTWNFQNF